LDAVLELKKKKRLPKAFKAQKTSKKPIIEKQRDVFTFLDKVFTADMQSGLFLILILINNSLN
jgi:hypothetical protein